MKAEDGDTDEEDEIKPLAVMSSSVVKGETVDTDEEEMKVPGASLKTEVIDTEKKIRDFPRYHIF